MLKGSQRTASVGAVRDARKWVFTNSHLLVGSLYATVIKLRVVKACHCLHLRNCLAAVGSSVCGMVGLASGLNH
jgi:hypothetical protein